MEKYYFLVNVFESNNSISPEYLGKQKVIKYKCPICDYTHDWDDSWTDEKKSEIKLEVDTHYNDHIIPVTSSDNTETPTSNS